MINTKLIIFGYKKAWKSDLSPVPRLEASRIAHLSRTSNAEPTPMCLYIYPYIPIVHTL